MKSPALAQPVSVPVNQWESPCASGTPLLPRTFGLFGLYFAEAETTVASRVPDPQSLLGSLCAHTGINHTEQLWK